MEPLRKMSTTKYLCLSCPTMQSLSSANLNDLPMFPYLTHLVVEIIDYSSPVLPHLLRCSPNLITLDLDIKYVPFENEEFGMPNFSILHLESVSIDSIGWSRYDMDMVKYFLKYAPVLKKMSISYSDTTEDSNLSNEEFGMPNFSMLHLESVNIHGLGWSQYVMDMVKYFLKYAPVLKKMSIYYSDTPDDSNLANEILLLPRTSTECELEVFAYSFSAEKYICISQSYQD